MCLSMSSSKTQPGAPAMASLTSSTVSSRSVTMLADMEWERITGTLTQVQVTRSSGRCIILRPSFCIFISSEV